MKHFEKQISSYAGTITVRTFPRFNSRVSTLDIKMDLLNIESLIPVHLIW